MTDKDVEAIRRWKKLTKLDAEQIKEKERQAYLAVRYPTAHVVWLLHLFPWSRAETWGAVWTLL